MLNKIEEMMDEMNARPNSEEGFSARDLYKTGMEFGLTCAEVQKIFLGKAKAIARGRYAATCSDDIVLAAAKAPVPVKKVAKKAAKKKAVKKVAKRVRNVSTAVVAKKAKISDEAKADRLALIAKIAKRHAEEDELVAELESSSNGTDSTDRAAEDAFAVLATASTKNPLG